MTTLNDIANDPTLTPQERACLYLFGHAAGDMDAVPCDRFETMFPERISDLDTDLQHAIPSRRAYDVARKNAIRVLAKTGHVQNPWEHLRMLIRCAGKHDIERHWSNLKTPALDAGLSPYEITTSWVWSLRAETAGGMKRQTLRRAVTMFNELFDIPEIAGCGLLPPERIGLPPVYDARGEIETPLPPTLSRIAEAAPSYSQSAIKRVWRIIQDFELTALADPCADDLMKLEPQLKLLTNPLTAADIGHTEGTWSLYRQRFFAALRSHLTYDDNQQISAPLAALETQNSNEDAAIRALWHQMRFAGIDNANTMMPADILALDTWRAIWTPRRPDITANSEKTYRATARHVLLHATPTSEDPLKIVRQAWLDLPDDIKLTLKPVRKAAERALLRPTDLETEWIAEQDLADDDRAAIVAITANIDEAIAGAVATIDAARTDPTAAWKALRKDAIARGFSTLGIGKVETRAISHNRAPRDLDLTWAQSLAEAMTANDRGKFAISLRLIDSMRADPDLARHLPTAPISAVQDKRHKGRAPIPESIARELSALATRRKMSHNTLRTWKSAAAVLADITGADTLAALIEAPFSAQKLLTDRQRRTLKNIGDSMERISWQQ